jgi:hypothetical protein
MTVKFLEVVSEEMHILEQNLNSVTITKFTEVEIAYKSVKIEIKIGLMK